jgi:hypothetical protein
MRKMMKLAFSRIQDNRRDYRQTMMGDFQSRSRVEMYPSSQPAALSNRFHSSTFPSEAFFERISD